MKHNEIEYDSYDDAKGFLEGIGYYLLITHNPGEANEYEEYRILPTKENPNPQKAVLTQTDGDKWLVVFGNYSSIE